MSVKRLLCIVGGMNRGGAETFLMKIYRGLDKTKYQMDFAVAFPQKGDYDDEILSMGGRIFHIVPKSRGLFKNFNDVRKLVKTEQYKYVLRTSQNSLSALELFAARLGGAKVCTYRSSNSGTVAGLWKIILVHHIFSFMPKIIPDVKIAPSTKAAEFMFGKDCIKKGKAHLLHNALDYDSFRFNEENRKRIREEMGLENACIIGHIGRFNKQKNHDFLIDIFKTISQKNENVRLVMVGVGELEEQIKNKVKSLQLEDKVVFLGLRSDVPNILSAFDVLLFPSFFEGMPNVVIEAQASGLPCVISDAITPEADITGLVKYCSLSESTDVWAEKVFERISNGRKDTFDDFVREGYNLNQVIDKFIELVFEEV